MRVLFDEDLAYRSARSFPTGFDVYSTQCMGYSGLGIIGGGPTRRVACRIQESTDEAIGSSWSRANKQDFTTTST